ncbi:MAG: hypothetical protein WC537_01035 [Candidatus Paceibacterota bacterium]|jgi:hypothetical protein
MVKKEEWASENKGKPWTDSELEAVLSDAPTKDNCEKYAKAFKRGRGSIEQIYRWAMTSKKEIMEKRGDEKFVNQIKKVSKKIGWVA